MWRTRNELGNGDLPKVVMEFCSEAGVVEHSCEIYLFGATLTSWKHFGTEKIFVSPSAIWNGVKAIRGGIPLVFPQFGQPNTSLPQHGFARIKNWDLSSTTSDTKSVTAEFRLRDDGQTFQQWPFHFALTYTVVLTASSLHCNLHISNIGESPFCCQALLHTYLTIGNINDVSIFGFTGLSYLDKVEAGVTAVDSDHERIIRSEVDRVYLEEYSGKIPDIIIRSINNESDVTSLKVMKRATHVKIGGVEDKPVDVVLWNPWIEKSTALVDMPNDGYLNFLCVEPGVVQGWTDLLPGECLSLNQELIPVHDSKEEQNLTSS